MEYRNLLKVHMESSMTLETRNMEAALPELTSHIKDMANSVHGKLNSREAIVHSGFSKNQDSLANLPNTSYFNSFLAHIGNFNMLSSIDPTETALPKCCFRRILLK